MKTADTSLAIVTLGRFGISVAGKPLDLEWPDDAVKELFCSLLSPLDLYFTWERICRSLLGEPETRTSRRRLDETLVRPLNSFLLKKLGFNPLIAGHDGLRITRQIIHVDVMAFHRAVTDGIRLFSIGSITAAKQQFDRAQTLYAGTYLPGMSGKIIESTRNELASFYQTAVIEGVYRIPSYMAVMLNTTDIVNSSPCTPPARTSQ